MGENVIPSSYIVQKPVFDREIKAPAVREWNMHKDFRDRFERKTRLKNEANKNFGEKLNNRTSVNILKVIGIAGILALVTEVLPHLKK